MFFEEPGHLWEMWWHRRSASSENRYVTVSDKLAGKNPENT
jgi:hypothetical protein